MADFIVLGVDIRNESVSNLASALLTGNRNEIDKKVDIITASSKIPPSRDLDQSTEEDLPKKLKNDLPIEPSPTEPRESSRMSLADAFAAPIGEIDNATGATNDPLSLGQQAFLEGSYTSALLHAKMPLRKTPRTQMLGSCAPRHIFNLVKPIKPK